jgi:hypothetical protein
MNLRLRCFKRGRWLAGTTAKFCIPLYALASEKGAFAETAQYCDVMFFSVSLSIEQGVTLPLSTEQGVTLLLSIEQRVTITEC